MLHVRPAARSCSVSLSLLWAIPIQDNNLAEALKARNLLAEFDTSTETALPAPTPRGGASLLLVGSCTVESVARSSCVASRHLMVATVCAS